MVQERKSNDRALRDRAVHHHNGNVNTDQGSNGNHNTATGKGWMGSGRYG